MTRFLTGALSALVLLTGGLFMWQGYAQMQEAEDAIIPAAPPTIPVAAAGAPKTGAPPPDVPAAKDSTREEKRFNRYDRDRNDLISRVELMSTRSGSFRKLDKDGNNLLTFEEWASNTGQKFAGADRDRSGGLTRVEFATTAPKRSATPKCAC